MMNMHRRKFLTLALTTTVAGAAGTGIWLNMPTNTMPLTTTAALSMIEHLSENEPNSRGQWDSAKVYIHCAQSIEYSMLGYPEHKSDMFKSTVGQLAFSLFSAKGRMWHQLSEDIPGAPMIANGQHQQAALARLRQAFIDFEHYSGELAPHFAYGKLTKAEYERAHVMHLYNHLQEIMPA